MQKLLTVSLDLLIMVKESGKISKKPIHSIIETLNNTDKSQGTI